MNKKIITTILTGIILASNISLPAHAIERKDIKENATVSATAKRMIVNGQIKSDATSIYTNRRFDGSPYSTQLGGGKWVKIDMATSDKALRDGYRAVFIKCSNPQVSGWIQFSEIEIDAGVLEEWGWDQY